MTTENISVVMQHFLNAEHIDSNLFGKDSLKIRVKMLGF